MILSSRQANDVLGEHRDRALSEAENRVRSELERGVASARNALENADNIGEKDNVPKNSVEAYGEFEPQNSLSRYPFGPVAFP